MDDEAFEMAKEELETASDQLSQMMDSYVKAQWFRRDEKGN